jgi:AraC-like DNA-binding protein
MQSVVRLATGSDFAVDAVTCTDDHVRWSAPQVEAGYELVFVRRGRFRRRAGGVAADIDPTMGYLSISGEEERFAHPAGGDVCTLVTLQPELWRTLTGEPKRLRRSTVYVDARLDLAHRRMVAAGRGGDVDFEVAEELLWLVGGAIAQAAPVPVDGRCDERALVDRARVAIVEDHPDAGGLVALARLLAVSPYRLSRAFSTELGVSLTRYRNRIRVGRALDRLADGAQNLADLAADLHFADQAHLCRTLRQHLGHTPTAVRRLLSAPPSDQRTDGPSTPHPSAGLWTGRDP